MVVVKLRSVDRIRDGNSERLIANSKLHLVLDLDQTLIHSTKITSLGGVDETKNIKDMYKIMGGVRVVKLRPGVREFLEEASSMFDISVYTMGEVLYANSIVDTLNNGLKKPIIGKVISREYSTTHCRKGLDVVMSRKELVLIVDDKVDVWMEADRANVLSIKPYYFFGRTCDDHHDHDQELGRVLGVLREVHSRFFSGFEAEHEKKDVRQLLQGVLKKKNKLGPKASGCRKVVFKLKVNGDKTRLFTTTMTTTSNGKEDDRNAKKRGREGNDCGRAMLHHGKECKWETRDHMLSHSLSLDC